MKYIKEYNEFDIDPFNEEDWDEYDFLQDGYIGNEYTVIRRHFFRDEHFSELNKPGNIFKVISIDKKYVRVKEFDKKGNKVLQDALGGNIKWIPIKVFNMKVKKGYIKLNEN